MSSFYVQFVVKFCRQSTKPQEHSDMADCLVEESVMSQFNSLSNVTSGYVTPEDRTKPSSNSFQTKPTQSTNVNTLTLALAKTLSPLH
jgi:hypothetical protein